MRFPISVFLIFAFFSAQGQVPTPVYKSIDMGLLYVNHVYYSFEEGVMASDTGKTWEIGFSVPGLNQGGIFINEYAERDMKPAVMQGPFPDFSISIPPLSGDTLRNSEINWLTGAFNTPNNSSNPFGWGTKSQTTESILGDQTYIIKIPGGTFKKLMIDSLSAGVYTFSYANLDGSDLRVVSIDMADYEGKIMAHYSLKTHEFVDIEPEKWDLLFTRVNDLATIPGQPLTNYNVTTVLTRHGIKTLELDNVDPVTVDTAGSLHKLVSDNNIIGHDWKTFDLDLFEWILDHDRCFFIELEDGCIWKFFIIDFEGAFSGIAYFGQAKHGCITHVTIDQNNSVFEEFSLFPNPVKDHINIIFSLKQRQQKVDMHISNMLGQVVYRAQTSGAKGRNAKSFQQIDLPPGHYSIQLYAGDEVIGKKIIISE